MSGLGLIFDLDGVIVDSNPVHTVSWRVYLRRCGMEPPENFERRMYGLRNDDIVRDLFGAGLDPAEVSRHGSDKEALYRELMRPVLHEHLVPGLVSFLERHREVPMAVATNGERANAEFVLEGGEVRRYFRVVVDGGQVSRPKPDPEIYLRAAELLGMPPADCIVFEDSVAGVEAARAAGTRVVALTTTHKQFESVELKIQDFLDAELEPWLSRQRPVT
ncbi:MAG: HAD family hydrolase [Bryobacteraceae bacterium]